MSDAAEPFSSERLLGKKSFTFSCSAEDHDRLPFAGRDLRLTFLKCSDRAALRASERISMIELLSCAELREGISNLDSSLQRGDALHNRGAMRANRF
jgi:hypothetical protein